MPFRQDAIGANAQYFWGQQVDFSTPILPNTRLRFKVGESVTANRTYSVSEEPNPIRDRDSVVETSRSPEGTLPFDMRTEGMGPIYKMALCSDRDVITLPNVDGGIRTQVRTQYDGISTTLACGFIPSTFPTGGGSITVVYRPAGNPLTAYTSVTATYLSHNGADFTLSAGLGLAAGEIDVEDYVFLEDSVNFIGAYTHYYEAGQKLETVSTIGIYRDIAMFHYYGVKAETLTETFARQSIISGTLDIKGSDSFWGGLLNAAVTAGDQTITLFDVDSDIANAAIFYPAGGSYTMWIGIESAITFTDASTVPGTISGIPAAGAGSITVNHTITPEREAVAFSSAPSILLTVTDDPLQSFSAGVVWRVDSATGTDVFSAEVFDAEYTVANNLFADKVALGSIERVALPEGIRDVTGKLTLEFDSPEEINRVRRNTEMRLEIQAEDQLNVIGLANVRKRNDTIFERIHFTGNIPVVNDTQVLFYDLEWRALAGQRKGSTIKIVTNSQASAVAGG